jgi:hypothetical protein
VSQLTENQTLVAMLHTTDTDTTDDDDIVHADPITRDGTPVFDQAEITVDPAEEDTTAGGITNSDVTLSNPEPTPGSNVTVTVTATPTTADAGFSFTHTFNQSVESASITSSSLTDTIVSQATQDGVTVTAAAGSFTPGETVTIEYTITTAGTVAKAVGITGSVTNGQTTQLPARSYTITSTPPDPDPATAVTISASPVAIDPTTQTSTTIPFEVTNTGEDTRSAVVNISESSLPEGLRLLGVSGRDPTPGTEFPVLSQNDSMRVSFSDIDPGETVTARAVVVAESDSIEGRLTAGVETDGVTVVTTSAEITALSAGASTVRVTPDDRAPTDVSVTVTNAGETTRQAAVNFSESSLPRGLTLENVSGSDPSPVDQLAVITDEETAEVAFSDIDPGETVTATASVSPTSEATVDSVGGSLQATVLRDDTTVATVRANLTTQQDIVGRYAGDDGEVSPSELLEAVADFRSGQLLPTDVLEVIAAFRE